MKFKIFLRFRVDRVNETPSFEWNAIVFYPDGSMSNKRVGSGVFEHKSRLNINGNLNEFCSVY